MSKIHSKRKQNQSTSMRLVIDKDSIGYKELVKLAKKNSMSIEAMIADMLHKATFPPIPKALVEDAEN